MDVLTYEDCANKGLTQAETARVIGVSREAVRQYAKRHNLKFAQGRQRGVPVGRFETMTEAAKAWQVSPQAVSQACRLQHKLKEGE